MTKRLTRDQQKKFEDDARLIETWRAWRSQELAEALAGKHGAVVSKIMAALARLDMNSGGALVTTVEQTDWRLVDAHVKLVLLHELNTAITDLRGRHGMAAIDDPLPGQPENVFQRIKRALFPALLANAGSPSSVGPQSAPGRSVTAAKTSDEAKHHDQ